MPCFLSPLLHLSCVRVFPLLSLPLCLPHILHYLRGLSGILTPQPDLPSILIEQEWKRQTCQCQKGRDRTRQ